MTQTLLKAILFFQGTIIFVPNTIIFVEITVIFLPEYQKFYSKVSKFVFQGSKIFIPGYDNIRGWHHGRPERRTAENDSRHTGKGLQSTSVHPVGSEISQ